MHVMGCGSNLKEARAGNATEPSLSHVYNDPPDHLMKAKGTSV